MINDHLMLLFRDVAILFPAFLIVFTFRGFARALVAKWMGDDTAYEQGFVTLNPLAHVDVFGLSIILLVIFLLGGLFGATLPRAMLLILLIFMGIRWTFPIPVEEKNFKSLKRGAILTILAGPLGGFVVAFIFLYLRKYIPYDLMPIYAVKSIIEICEMVIDLAVFFGVLDLLPIPPFDGGKLLRFFLPYSKRGFLDWLEEYSLYIMLALFFLPVVSDVFFITIGFLGSFIKSFLLIFVI